MRLPWVLLLCAALAACGVLPRPFQPPGKEQAERLVPRLGAWAGVVVRPVEGLPPALAAALAESVVRALDARGVPASARFTNRAGLRLTGRAAGHGLLWSLVGPDGATTLRLEEPKPRAAWADTTVLDADAIAERTAARIAAALEPPAPGAKTAPPVVLWSIDGAPGDGGPELRRAMRRSLAAAGVALAETPGDETLLLLGSVHRAPDGRARARESVEIAWTVLRPDGTGLGTVVQTDSVPAGRLGGAWGALADEVAAAAAPAVAAMLRQAAVRAER